MLIAAFVSKRVAKQAQILEHQALHDELTGLPNRTLFQDRLEQAIQRAQREDISFAIILMDLDHFKEVNDTLGHNVGDLLGTGADRAISGDTSRMGSLSPRNQRTDGSVAGLRLCQRD